jgi:hypothetical protein
MIIHECEQGSDAWKLLRVGKITASNFSDVLNRKTGRGTYMRRLVAERLTGQPVETYKNGVMLNGTETEPLAREYYEQLYGVQCRQVGFIELDEWVGVSPDALIDVDGGLEIKCPLSSTHVGYILDGRVPSEYIPQIQGSLWVTGRKWWDFMSFCPAMRTRKDFIVRVYRDEKYINILAEAVNQFKTELQKMIQTISNPF